MRVKKKEKEKERKRKRTVQLKFKVRSPDARNEMGLVELVRSAHNLHLLIDIPPDCGSATLKDMKAQFVLYDGLVIHSLVQHLSAP